MFSAFCIAFLCGCNDYQEIDRGYFVTAIGICESGDTTQIYVEAQATSATDKGMTRFVLTGSGVSIGDAFKHLNEQLVKPLYFEQIGTIIFENTPTKDTFDFVTDTLKFNRGIYLVQTDNVKKLFDTDFQGEILGYDIIGLIKNFEKENNINTHSRLFEKIKYTDPLSKIAITSNGISFVFKGDAE